MPSLQRTVELVACVEDTIVILLIMDGTGNAIPEHPLCQRRQRLNRVLLEKSGRRRTPRGPELVELILGCGESAKSTCDLVIRQ